MKQVDNLQRLSAAISVGTNQLEFSLPFSSFFYPFGTERRKFALGHPIKCFVFHCQTDPFFSKCKKISRFTGQRGTYFNLQAHYLALLTTIGMMWCPCLQLTSILSFSKAVSSKGINDCFNILSEINWNKFFRFCISSLPKWTQTVFIVFFFFFFFPTYLPTITRDGAMGNETFYWNGLKEIPFAWLPSSSFPSTKNKPYYKWHASFLSVDLLIVEKSLPLLNVITCRKRVKHFPSIQIPGQENVWITQRSRKIHHSKAVLSLQNFD